MIGFVMIGTNNLESSSKFYDIILKPLGLVKSINTERYIGYASEKKPDFIEFYITKPYNNKLATAGNGTMISFLTNSKHSVDMFHKAALEIGAKDEGMPGLRPSDGSIYYAYIRDLDGNKICAHANNIKT